MAEKEGVSGGEIEAGSTQRQTTSGFARSSELNPKKYLALQKGTTQCGSLAARPTLSRSMTTCPVR